MLSMHEVEPMIKFGSGSIMIWGCMTYYGTGYACRIDGRMNAELYNDILSDELTKTIEYYKLNRQNIIFQHDNDSKHTAHSTRRWLKTNQIKLLDWPAQSPDLNLIEHLWWHLKSNLNQYNDPPGGMLQLWECIEVEWNRILRQICIDLIESMPRCINAVLKAWGGYVKY